MKAMILAAGLGTRLRPLTDRKPKALMPLVNKPMIERVIVYLKSFGITRIVINTHHHHEQLTDYLEDGRPFGLEIETRFEPEILGTGGGIKNTSDFWDDDPFLVVNSDIVTNIDLEKAYEGHRRSGALVTLILHEYERFNQVLVGEHSQITDIASENLPGRLAFTGIHILNPEVLSYIPDRTFSDIITCYRQLIHTGKAINAFISKGHYWYDIGTLETYVEANKNLLEKAYSIGSDCDIDSTARLEDWVIVGKRTHLKRNVKIMRSILWEDVSVGEGITVIDSIVTSSRHVDRDLTGEVF